MAEPRSFGEKFRESLLGEDGWGKEDILLSPLIDKPETGIVNPKPFAGVEIHPGFKVLHSPLGIWLGDETDHFVPAGVIIGLPLQGLTLELNNVFEPLDGLSPLSAEQLFLSLRLSPQKRHKEKNKEDDVYGKKTDNLLPNRLCQLFPPFSFPEGGAPSRKRSLHHFPKSP